MLRSCCLSPKMLKHDVAGAVMDRILSIGTKPLADRMARHGLSTKKRGNSP